MARAHRYLVGSWVQGPSARGSVVRRRSGGAGGVSSNASVGPHVRALAACGGRAPDQIRDKEGRRRRLKVGG